VTAGTAEVVITTKLFRPGLRQQTVERKRLCDLLREGRTLPLTLVVAPAGWGKSTIVADWLARLHLMLITVATSRYRIVLRGRLSDRFESAFDWMTLEHGPNGPC
jgi:hypothetical protein